MRESALLQHIYDANPRLARGDVVVPPGDDLGGVRVGGTIVLAGVDQLVDGRHFRLDVTPIELVGRKAITRCLSDAAAMIARPIATLVAATLPPNFGEARANALFDAMRATAERYASPLIGGDIAFHSSETHPLVISTTVLAVPALGRPITRGGAKTGDGVYVTGPLGGSLQADGLGRHLTFEPRIELAQAIGRECGIERIHAMIDISDGLGRDASHIAEMSNAHIVLDAAAIPCNAGCTWRNALSDGEDYELLFCASGAVPPRLGGQLIHRVGKVAPREHAQAPLVVVRHDGQATPAGDLGWEHRS